MDDNGFGLNLSCFDDLFASIDFLFDNLDDLGLLSGVVLFGNCVKATQDLFDDNLDDFGIDGFDGRLSGQVDCCGGSCNEAG